MGQTLCWGGSLAHPCNIAIDIFIDHDGVVDVPELDGLMPWALGRGAIRSRYGQA